MQGKVVVVTGGTSGIGQVAAERLAGMGARIVLVARDKARADATLALLRKANGGAEHTAHLADLSSIAATKAVAAEIAAAEPRIDVLINNAGALFNHRQLSPDGLEMTFAVNHMAYFVLTEGLRERLAETPRARIVSTASAAHQGARLNMDDLQSEQGYSGFAAYGRSKLCNILWTREAARRFELAGVTANCLHPGFVATRFGDRSGGLLQALMPLAKLMAISPDKGAETIVFLASSPEAMGVSGKYFYQSKAIDPTPEAQDDAVAAWLWAQSARLSAMVGVTA
jgi:NAD(P)-dependent dehydrogenase (short-subunit alcohol dehydrogenase family)